MINIIELASDNFKLKGQRDLEKMIKENQEKVREEFLDQLSDAVLSEAEKLLKEGPIKNSKSKNKNAYYTGELARSGFIAKDSETKRRVVFDTAYAVATEYGRPKGSMPPVEPLQKWAKYRGMKNPESAGWAIAKSIEKKGMKPRPFLQPAVLYSKSQMKKIWLNVIKKVRKESEI